MAAQVMGVTKDAVADRAALKADVVSFDEID